MKCPGFVCLTVLALSGMVLSGCARPSSAVDAETRLEYLENKVASYSELQARVDALEDAVVAKGIMEPRLPLEALPPVEETEEPTPLQSTVAMSAVPGQREITTPPVDSKPVEFQSVEPQSAGAPLPPPVAAPPVQTAEEKEVPSPFTTAQRAEVEPPSPFTAEQSTETTAHASPFRTTQNATQTVARAEQGQAMQPPLPELDSYPQGQNVPPAPTPPVAETPPAAEGRPVIQPETPAPPPAPAPTPAPAPAPVTDKGAYEAALRLYESGKYADSRQAMSKFLEAHPSSPYVPNALYWIGETYYSQSQWGEAIMGFKDVVSRFPKHAKAADALLKLGMSYARLGDKDNARFHYEALLEDFPDSKAAALAKSKLAAL